MSDPTQEVTIVYRGTGSRPARMTGGLPFEKVTLQPTFERSHIIPKNIRTNHSAFFDAITKAELPDDVVRFDIDDFLINGQPLPSKNGIEPGVTVFDLSQHRGSHPTISNYIDKQVVKYESDLLAVLNADPPSSAEARQAAILRANKRITDLKDVTAALSIGNFADPANPALRALYNITDANADAVIEGWGQLNDAQKKIKLVEYNDELFGKFINEAGDLTEEGIGKIKILRDLTGDLVSAASVQDVKIANAVFDELSLRGIKPGAVDALTFVESNKRIVPPGLTARLETLIAKRGLTTLGPKAAPALRAAGLKLLAKTVAKVSVVLDVVDYGGTALAMANGDARFDGNIFGANRFNGGMSYINDILTKPGHTGLLGDISIPGEYGVKNGDKFVITNPTGVQGWLTQNYKLPPDLKFEVYPDSSSPVGYRYKIFDVHDPAKKHVLVVWKTSPGSQTPEGKVPAAILRRAGPNDTDLVVQEVTSNVEQGGMNSTAQVFPDPDRKIEGNVLKAMTGTPAERQAAQAELEASGVPGVVVTFLMDGVIDPASVQNAVEVIQDAGYRPMDELTHLPPELHIYFDESRSEERGVLNVVVDGVIQVFRGTFRELRQIVGGLVDYLGKVPGMLAAGPAPVLKDLKDIGKTGALITFEDMGTLLASQLMQALPIEDPWERIAVSTTLGTVLGGIGQIFDLDGTMGVSKAFDTVLADLDEQVLSSATGAISSYLVGNLLADLGLEGDTLDAAMAFAGPVVGKIAFNILNGSAWNAGLTTGFYATAAATFLGGKLADKIVSFDSYYGQLGSALGEAVGSLVATKLFATSLASGNPYAIAAAAIVVALSKILGGVIGSLFGPSTSTSSVLWSERDQRFLATAASAQAGGSAQAAFALSSAVTDVLNNVLDSTGSRLIGRLPTQSLGMYNKDYIYWDAPAGYGISNKSTDFNTIMKFAVKVGLDRAITQMGGGNIFAKRAIASDLAMQSAVDFSVEGLLGDLTVARDYAVFSANRKAIQNLIAEQPDSAFAATWLVTLARARELGLDRRAPTDWIGGWNLFLDENTDGIIDGSAWSPGAFDLKLDTTTGERIFSFLGEEGEQASLGDTIDTASMDKIVGTQNADTIIVQGAMLQATGISLRARDGGLELVSEPHHITIAASIDAGDGNDFVIAGNLGNDVLGGGGDDKLVGGTLDDWLFGGDGDDVLTAGSIYEIPGFDAQAFIAGNAATMPVDADKLVRSDGGNGNLLDGGAGNDRLYGGKGSDWLRGGEGADRLWGGDGGDIMAGGAGNDRGANGEAVILGGGGSDQYVFGYGDGADVVFDESDPAGTPGMFGDSINTRVSQIDAGALTRNWAGGGDYEVDGSVRGGEDAIAFGVGITMHNLRMHRSSANGQPGQDLIIELTAADENGVQQLTGDSLTVKDWFESTRRIEWLRFANGDEIRIGDISSFIIGVAGQSVILGTDASDWIVGTDGADLIYGLRGDDFGFGGLGADLVAGDNDNDLVSGGAGDDSVIGGDGNDTVMGDGGNDRVLGGMGADLLSGGLGDDTIVTGQGDDVVRYERGDGRDVLLDDLVANWDQVYSGTGYVNGYVLNNSDGTVSKDGIVYFDGERWLEGAIYYWDDGSRTLSRHKGAVNGVIAQNNGVDTLEFGIGIDVQDLMLHRVGQDLEIVIRDSDTVDGFADADDKIVIRDWWTTTGIENKPIEKFGFAATGTLLTSSYSIGAAASDAGDTITGGANADWITGGQGNDVLDGGAGDDLLSGGQGGDRLLGGAGSDVLYGGADNDILDGGAGTDLLFGGSGRDRVSYASSGYSSVRAYLGASALNAGNAAGDKFDAVEDIEGGSGNDRLAGDDFDNRLRGNLGDDRLWGGDGDDIYEIGRNEGWDQIFEGTLAIEEIVNEAGALQAGYTASWEFLRYGTVSGGTVQYYQYQLTVRRDADDKIVYKSRAGVDFLFPTEQATAPTAGFWPYASGQWQNGASRANGVQVVRESVTGAGGGKDTLLLDAGLSLSDLIINRFLDHITILTVGGSVDIYGATDTTPLVETLQLADGLTADLTRLLLGGWPASDADEFVVSNSQNEVLEALGGNDVLSGGAGNDTLRGGSGNDTLEGGTGADVLDGGTDSQTNGTPIDPQNPASYGDTIRYVTSTAALAVDLATLTISGGAATGDTIVAVDGVSTIENVTGTSGFGDQLRGDSRANRLLGLGGADTIEGRDGDDALLGGDGNDILLGGNGDDLLLGESGDDQLDGGAGRDLLSGGDGIDILVGGADDDQVTGDDGNDTLSGGDGVDLLGGGAGNDSLDGGAGNDTLSGGGGSDSLTGGDGNDFLMGEAGDDLLFGGLGDDRYVFGANDGADRISDASGANVIALTGVASSAVWLSRNGDDLMIGVIGATTRITVAGYYAGSSSVREIAIDGASLFLASAGPIVAAMTASSAAVPAVMPEAISALLATYWHAGGSAAPMLGDLALTTTEDTPLSGQVVASDDDGNIVYYSVANQASNGAVVLNVTTGAWTYTPNANSQGEDSFLLLAHDADGNATSQRVTVNVTPVNDNPSFSAMPAPIVLQEGVSAGAVLGSFAASDPDTALFAPRFSLLNDAGGRFAITSDGALSVVAGAVLDYEVAPNISIIVRVTDEAGGKTDQPFSIAITNRNEAPSGITVSGLSIAENRPAGTLVGTVAATDPDGVADTLALALLDDAGGRFELVGGQLRTTASLDHEGAPSYTVQISAVDQGGLAIVRSFTVNVTNVNEAPTAITVGALSVAENASANTSIATFAASDPDAGDTISFGLANDADGRFAISTGGELTVAPGASLDYDTTSSHTIVVRVVDSGGQERLQSFTVALTNVNETPAMPMISSAPGAFVPENSDQGGAIVAVFTLFDPDRTVPQLTIGGDTQNLLAVSGNTIVFRPGIRPDFESLVAAGATRTDSDGDGISEALYTVQVAATDGALTSASTPLQIRIEDINEAPTALVLTPSVSAVTERDKLGNELPPAAVQLGTLSATDPDLPTSGAFATLVYVVADPRLEIRNGNQLWLKGGGMESLDFETNPFFTVTVEVRDLGGAPGALSRSQSFVFNLQDRNDVQIGSAAGDTLTGQSGRDILDGLDGADVLTGLAGDDDLLGGAGNDTLDAGTGNDLLDGGDGGDTLLGAAGTDRLWGGIGDDLLVAGDGDDRLTYMTGDYWNDARNGFVRAGAGNDTIQDGAGSDQAWGEEGDDLYLVHQDGGATSDMFDGGNGTNTISFANFTSGATASLATKLAGDPNQTLTYGDTFLSVQNVRGSAYGDTLAGDEGANLLQGYEGADTLSGNGGDDTLDGGDGNDVLMGGAGADTLVGGAGDDYLDAQSGNDTLIGGTGNDVLIGGDDSDTYLLDENSGVDEIRNFDPSGDDIDVVGYRDIDRGKLWFEKVGNNLVVSVIGTSVVTTIKDWYTVTTASDRANYRIDFIQAGGSAVHSEINAQGLVDLMAGYAKPATAADFAALHGNLAFENQWKNYWDANGAPVFETILDKQFAEGGALSFKFLVTDDITGNNGLIVKAKAVTLGNYGVEDTSVVYTPQISDSPDENGKRTLTLTGLPFASGQVAIRIQATDPGGLIGERIFLLTVTPEANAPQISQARAVGTTLDSGSLALDVQAALRDTDGSETLEILISNVPSALSLNHGTNLGNGTWRLAAGQLPGLALIGPANWSADLTGGAALTVTATARETTSGQTSSTTATLNIPINTRPTGITANGPLAVNETTAESGGVANGTEIARFSRTDADGDSFRFSLADNAGGRFIIDSDGTLRVANNALLNRESAASHDITVRVTDSGELSYDRTFTVAVNDVNERPSVPVVVSQPQAIRAEGSTADLIVATYSASDPDAGQSPGFFDSFDPYDWFYVSGNQLHLRSGINVDFEWLKAQGNDTWRQLTDIDGNGRQEVSLRIGVSSTDGQYGSADQSWVWYRFEDVNEAPSTPVPNPLAQLFSEGTSSDVVIVTYSATDPEGVGLAYAETLDPWDWLYVSGGQLHRRAGINIDFEWLKAQGTDSWRQITDIDGDGMAEVALAVDVAASDGVQYGGSTRLWYYIEDVNEAPTSITPDRTLNFNETIPGYTGIAWLTAADPESNVASWSLLSDAGGRFALRADGLLMTGALPLDYENGGGSSSILARVTDSKGAYYDQWLTVTVNNLPEAPYSISADRPLSFGEGIGANVGIAWMMAADPEGNIAYWTMLDSAGGRFALRSDGLLMTGASALDYENGGGSSSILVRATDTTGYSYDQWVTVNVTNVNEAPYSLWADRSLVFDEGIGAWTGIAWFGGADPEANISSFSLAGDANGRFAMRSDGLLMVGNRTLDYESEGGASTIIVRATDAYGAIYDQSFTVNVRDVNEAPTISNQSFQMYESYGRSPPGTYLVGTVVASDSDSGGFANLRYSITGGDSSRFSIDSATGRIFLQGIVDYETQQSHQLQVTVTDSGGTGIARTADITISVIDENDAPTIAAQVVGATGAVLPAGTGKDVVFTGADVDTAGAYTWRVVSVTNNNGNLPAPTAPGGAAYSVSGAAWRDAVYTPFYRPGLTATYTITWEIKDAAGATAWYSFTVQNQAVARIAPIVLDLDGDGISLIAREGSTIAFDQDADGLLDRTGWVAAGDGMLVLDRNHNGQIDDGSEIRFSTDEGHAVSDLEGLRNYDTNGNGLLDEGDAAFGAFQVWQDSNQNGISTADELRTLSELGISTINLTLAGSTDPESPDENHVYGTTIFHRRDGTVGTVGDVMLAYEGTPTVTQVPNPSSVFEGVLPPVVLDLDGDGLEIVARDASTVRFDIAGDGRAVRTGWVAGDDGFLALDRNGDGLIGSGAEISFVSDLAGATTDLEGLAAFDSNANGFLDAGDARYAEFRIWQDRNQDCISQASELTGLAQAGVQAINLTRRMIDAQPSAASANQLVATSDFIRADGSLGRVGDVMLAYGEDTAPTEANGGGTSPVDRAARDDQDAEPIRPRKSPVGGSSDLEIAPMRLVHGEALQPRSFGSMEQWPIASPFAQGFALERSGAARDEEEFGDLLLAGEPSALDTRLTLSNKTRFQMIQAIAGFSDRGAFGTDRYRQGHAQSMALLTALPDFRRGQ